MYELKNAVEQLNVVIFIREEWEIIKKKFRIPNPDDICIHDNIRSECNECQDHPTKNNNIDFKEVIEEELMNYFKTGPLNVFSNLALSQLAASIDEKIRNLINE